MFTPEEIEERKRQAAERIVKGIPEPPELPELKGHTFMLLGEATPQYIRAEARRARREDRDDAAFWEQAADLHEDWAEEEIQAGRGDDLSYDRFLRAKGYLVEWKQ